jgi:hypothetical protein
MKRSLTLATLSALGLIALVTGSVSARPDAQTDAKPATAPKPESGKSDHCFDANSVKGFNPVDSNHIEITDFRGRTFLLELTGACFGLEDALRLGLRARGSQRVCGPFDADVIYKDTTSDKVRTCQIVSITEASKPAAPDKPVG